jgi:hypothetical protein
MISFEVKWTNKQKFLGVISGILTITDQNTYIQDENKKEYHIYYRILGKCEVTIQEGSTSFKSIEGEKGIPSILLELLGDQIKDSLRAYYSGFLMRDKIYGHVHTTNSEKTTDWAKRKVKEMEPYLKKILFKDKTRKEINSILENLFNEDAEKDATRSNRKKS